MDQISNSRPGLLGFFLGLTMPMDEETEQEERRAFELRPSRYALKNRDDSQSSDQFPVDTESQSDDEQKGDDRVPQDPQPH